MEKEFANKLNILLVELDSGSEKWINQRFQYNKAKQKALVK